VIRINLVPQELLDREAQKRRVAQAGVILGLVLFVGVGISFLHYHRKIRLEKKLQLAQAELGKLKDVKDKLAAAKSRQAQVLSRRAVIKGLMTSRRFYPRFMSDLADVLPSGIWLEALALQGGPEGLNITVSAGALQSGDITDWFRTLSSTGTTQLFGKFSEPNLGAIAVAPLKNSFTMKIKYSAVAQ
jgi:Tfp pilus assembly protein PilN